VKRPGLRHAKLDKHDFTGIFIGYTATDSNIRYIDLISGLVKTSHHAVFDECWFHQPWRPPAAQLLYDLGIKLSGALPPAVPDDPIPTAPDDASVHHVPTPAIDNTPTTPPGASPPTIIEDDTSVTSPNNQILDVYDFGVYSAETLPTPCSPPPPGISGPSVPSEFNVAAGNRDAAAVEHHNITQRDIAQIYFSSHCFGVTSEETFVYHGSPILVHPTAGLVLTTINGRVIITSITPGTPCAKIPRWKTRLRNTWLTHVNDTRVESLDHVATLFADLPRTSHGSCRITVVAPELRDGLTNEGIPQLTLDQLNPRHFFPTQQPDTTVPMICTRVSKSWDGGVLQYVAQVTKLTRGVLLKQPDWDEWLQAEFLQLDQYDLQHMFGDPVILSETSAVFNLVWTYAVKEIDNRKKA
jgi:hypothetical protein